jgi:ATP-dependent Lon protease
MFEVPVEKLRWTCDPEQVRLGGSATASLTPLIVGQERALRALRLGLSINLPGYNIFVTGLTGTGRTTTVRRLLSEFATIGERPPDIAYVNNFEHPEQPICLKLPAGTGRVFQRSMLRMVDQLRSAVQSVFDSSAYRDKRTRLIADVEERQDAVRIAFEERLDGEGFALVEVQMGEYSQPQLLPRVDGEPVEFEELERRAEAGSFPEAEIARLEELRKGLSVELEEMVARMKALRKEARRGLEAMRREFAMPVVRDIVGDIRTRHPGVNVDIYLNALQEDILANVGYFEEPDEDTDDVRRLGDLQARYGVNLLVDNSSVEARPVVFETAPTFHNVFGMIEKRRGEGTEGADYRDIRAGSLVRANGGYLVLNAADVLDDLHVWSTLKRTLRTRMLEIQSYDPFFHFVASALKPVPIEIDVKVIVIGGADLYHALYSFDDEFNKIFKVVAEFDSVLERGRRSIAEYIKVIEKIRFDDRLRPVSESAVALLVEHGVRLAGRQDKLSTQFGLLGDVLREADYFARDAAAEEIDAAHVQRAIDERVFRSRMVEDKIREMIINGELMIDTVGRRVGQVNGLTITDLGYYAFGTPVRITASASIGRTGIVNIEKEVGMSGASYNKGVLIISGFIQDRYAHDKPLSLSASVTFEQSYSGVDGDSASSTEIYAILSVLSDVPLRQDIGVTGSVNQKGDIQPIGGVNEKIEGFYEVCKTRGLTGDQGVMIPVLNIPDLQLRKDVVEAVARGQFHVWAVANIDEGIELLTGLEAGAVAADGTYPPGSVNGRVNETLQRWASTMRDYRSL